MAIQVITIEREYGSGGALIAEKLARHLGWRLWDRDLTGEIARVAKVDQKAAQRCDERVDPLLYRLFKVFARGSYERALPLGDATAFDTDRMVVLLHQVIERVAGEGRCVVVGRGSPYILRNRVDAFHVFVYAAREEKIRRLLELGKGQREAEEMVDTVDREREAFIKRYFGKQWPHRPLYNLMINSKMGDENVMAMILHGMAIVEKSQAPASASR